MAKIIEADVIQKIATEAEWLTQTRIPYKGQIMIVSDSTGKVVNMKVGDGVNPFADLNYMFDSIQQNAQYVPITGNALPTPSVDPAWGMVTEGTYTFGGTDVFIVPDGHWGIANYSSGVWSLVDMGGLPQAINKIPFWEPGTYSQGDQRIHNGQIWSVNALSTTEEPGTGVDWTEPLTYQLMNDIRLETVSKTVTGAINELKRGSINAVPGNNIFDPYRGQENHVINETGAVVPSSNWYTSPHIPWNDETEASVYARAWAQYDASGAVVSSWFNTTSNSIEQNLTKHADAVTFRASVPMGNREISRANYGAELLPFERYFLRASDISGAPIYGIPEPKEYLKEMFFAESFLPRSATYTDGLIDSPVNVSWVDGGIGVITLIRNSNGSVTQATATHTKNEITRTLTVTITRDTEDNATNVAAYVNQ